LKPKPFLSEVGLWGFLRRNCVKQIVYDSDMNRAIELIGNWKPDVIFGMSSYFRILLEHAKSIGRSLDCKNVITTAEVLDRLTRAHIEDSFKAAVYDHYGMEEVGGSVAWECPTHFGYHINDETVALEFLRDGEPVAPGEPGEVHITSLTHTATPIIRYATGDIATPIEEECECGRSLSMLKDIQGRVLDALVTTDGKHIFTIISRVQEIHGLKQFKVVQNRDFSVDLFVRIAPGMESSVRDELERTCVELLGKTPTRIIPVERIEHVSGQKFRIVESKLTSLG
jgi:phenylacetate-CoA ligase